MTLGGDGRRQSASTRVDGKVDLHQRAFAGRRVDREARAVGLHHRLGQRQAEPGAVAARRASAR